ELSRLRGKNITVISNAILLVCFVLLIWHGAMIVYRDGHIMSLPDTRENALAWIKVNIPAHDAIVEEQGGPDLNSDRMYPLSPEPWYFITEIRPLFFRKDMSEDPLDMLIGARPKWVITSSQVKARYMREGAEKEFPGIVAAFRLYYSLIEGNLTEVARFSPDENTTGPEIIIYEVPRGFWEKVHLQETSVEDVLKDGN
ncbi:MAG: hypothetical protein ABIC40_07690, partial [bacterium]